MQKKIILVGKGGSGKDFIFSKFKNRAKLHTTRAPRASELKGKGTHFFIEFEEFQKMDFISVIEFRGWSYGLTEEEYQKCSILNLTPHELHSFKYRNECIVVFLDIDEDVRIERLSKRKDGDLARRLYQDSLDFHLYANYDIRITNPYFKVKDVKNVIKNYINL